MTLSPMLKKFFKTSKKEKDAIKKKRVEARKKLSLAYQLGFYVGEKIVRRHLPTLSVDSIQTNKNISVTCAEGDECRRLDNIWFNKSMSFKGTESEKAKATEQEWKALRAYHEMLEEKYLPKTVECHFRLLNVPKENLKEFKTGISASLWDCDCSHYSVKLRDINVKADKDGYFTIITLKKG